MNIFETLLQLTPLAGIFQAASLIASLTLHSSATIPLAPLLLPQVPSSVSAPPQEPETILFVGDMMFDRYIRTVAEKQGGDFILSCASDVLKTSDIVVGNLEGPITENKSVSRGTKSNVPNHFTFTFPTGTAALLARHNISVVNLGNNHIANFGNTGMEQTKKYLDNAGIEYFGGVAGNEPILRKGDISFISYNQFGGMSAEKVATTIATESAAGQTVAVYAHWGEEYTQDASRLQKIATLFVDKGADAIIGSHGHVVMKNERINNVPVYYSLGNFVFDQYWSKETMKGLAVELQRKGSEFVSREYAVEIMTNGKTCIRQQD